MTLNLKTILAVTTLAAASFNACAARTTQLWHPVAYGADKAQTVDFLATTAAPVGLLVWIHGGTWTNGDKGSEQQYLEQFAREGISVLNVNYRIRQAGVFPNAVTDIKSILEAITAGGCADCVNTEMWKVIKTSAKRGVMLGGLEAGGYLAVYAGSQQLTYKPETKLRCIAGVKAPLDFRQFEMLPKNSKRDVEKFIGHTPNSVSLTEMSPAAKITSGQWMNLEKVKWYFHFVTDDTDFPYELSKDIPNMMGASGFRVYQSVSESQTTGKRAGKVTLKGPEYQNIIATQVHSCFNIK